MTNTHPFVTVTHTNLVTEEDIVFFRRNTLPINNSYFFDIINYYDIDKEGNCVYNTELGKQYKIVDAVYLSIQASSYFSNHYEEKYNYYLIMSSNKVSDLSGNTKPETLLLLEHQLKFEPIIYNVGDIIIFNNNKDYKYMFTDMVGTNRHLKMIRMSSNVEYTKEQLIDIFTKLIQMIKEKLPFYVETYKVINNSK